MIHPDRALELLASTAKPLPTRAVSLSRAAGHVLAQEVRARVSFPPAPVAAMDGYAVRLPEACGQALPMLFTVAAGDDPPPLPAGGCARIFTGAVVPEGATAVVAQEDVGLVGEQVRFPPKISPGDNIRQKGEVFAQGVVLAEPGVVLTPAHLALLAAAGKKRLLVHPRPRVAVVATGSELADEKLTRGKIFDSNTPMLESFLLLSGFAVAAKARVPDQLDELQKTLTSLLAHADVVITTGGVSVGDLDLLPQAVQELGGEVIFHKVAMQPGKPVLAARVGERFILGLPGNPVSALVGFRLFALPLLRALAGFAQAFHEPWTPLPLAGPVSNRGQRVQFRPARELPSETGKAVEVLPWKGSHDLKAAAQATHLARLDAGFAGQAGDRVLAVELYRPR